MRYSVAPLIFSTITLLGCLPTEPNDKDNNSDNTSPSKETDNLAFSAQLSGTATGYTSDVTILLTINGTEEEVVELLYVEGDYPEITFATELAEGDALSLSATPQSIHEQCEVTALSTPVQDSTPTFALTCSDTCADDAVCMVWRNTHNDLRASMSTGAVTDDGTNGNYPLPSAPLPELVWNEKLAQVAQAHADSCVYGHNSDRQTEYVALGGENIYLGENIAVNYTLSQSQTEAYYAEDQVNRWWDEHADWHYQTYQSATINGAGHFTQIIWANTVEIGCGMAVCPNLSGDFTGYYGVCDYAPGGNWFGQYPYVID